MRFNIIALAFSFSVLASLVACSTTPSSEELAKISQLEQTTPTCSSDKDCKAKWEAAQLWIVHNAGYKLQTATDVLLETYSPSKSSMSLAARVTKEPQGGGVYKIIIKTWCANVFGCAPDTWDAALDFNKKVGAATP